MRLDTFQFHTPNTVEEACHLLDLLSGTARVMAGGTDLLADMKQGKFGAEHMVSLRAIEEMKTIERTDEGLRIGALVTPTTDPVTFILLAFPMSLLYELAIWGAKRVESRIVDDDFDDE